MWVVWSWLIIGVFSTIIALADAEIASAYPTAGGLYYWASKLGGPGWGWATGWFNLIGQIAVTAAIGFGLATFAEVLFTFWFDYGPHMADWGCLVRQSVFILYAIFLLAAALINVFDIRVTSTLNTISAYWHMIGVAFIVGVLIIVPDKHQSFSYVFTERVNNTGFGGGSTSFDSAAFWLVLGLGLLMAQYTITGFDASAHTAEETHQASRTAAVGMYMSVVVSVFFGWILLLAVTFSVPSTDFALEQIDAVAGGRAADVGGVDGVETWGETLLFICVVAQFFCVTASTTSASRMMFAFSRDGAVPGHQAWRRVSKHRVPVWSVFGVATFAGLLMVPAIWNYLVGLRGRYGNRRHRPLHRLRHPHLPADAAGRQVRARRVVARPPLQVARHDLHPLGGGDHGAVLDPALQGGAPVGRELHVGADELHGALVRGHRPLLRRLVGAVGQASGSRARCAWAPRKSSSGWRRSRRRPSPFRPTRATRASGVQPLSRSPAGSKSGSGVTSPADPLAEDLDLDRLCPASALAAGT